jgi:hypothetical protein
MCFCGNAVPQTQNNRLERECLTEEKYRKPKIEADEYTSACPQSDNFIPEAHKRKGEPSPFSYRSIFQKYILQPNY